MQYVSRLLIVSWLCPVLSNSVTLIDCVFRLLYLYLLIRQNPPIMLSVNQPYTLDRELYTVLTTDPTPSQSQKTGCLFTDLQVNDTLGKFLQSVCFSFPAAGKCSYYLTDK